MSKKTLGLEVLDPKKNLGTKQKLGLKKFWPNKLRLRKISPTKLWVQKNLGSKHFLSPTNFRYTNFGKNYLVLDKRSQNNFGIYL